MEKLFRLIIWGAGYEYSTVANTIFSSIEKGQIEVLGIMADSLPPTGTLDGFPILPKNSLREIDFDYVLFCLQDDNKREIDQLCHSYCLQRSQIIWSRPMHMPHFDFSRYMRLRKSNVTIVADICWSGMLYKSLDLKCNSPFFNLYIENSSYLRLLDDLRGYCSQNLVLSQFDRDSRGVIHPVMMLGDVELHFNHVETPEEAEAQWSSHLARINWDNLFIMMHTTDRQSERLFNALEEYTKRICFVPYETSEPYSLNIYQHPDEQHFHDSVNRTAMGKSGSYPFDPVKLLLGEPDFIRYKPKGEDDA